MKKLLMLIAVMLLCSNGIAQEKTYLLFELMKVDNEQESAYADIEDFWEKIHVQRVKNGDIVGWDLWSLKPGGENQGFQYMTVNVYNDPVKMFSGAGDFGAAVKAAYPDMSDEKMDKIFDKTGKSRDLAIRMYLEIVKTTTGEFSMDLGTVAYIDFMKATDGNSAAYEKAEIETFLPLHQKQVDAGAKGSWQLIRVMAPVGSDIYASHLTVNMFTGFDQVFNSPGIEWGSLGEEVNEGAKTRDMKSTSIATLIKKVR